MANKEDRLDQMRQNFRTVAADRKRCGHWTGADEVEAGQMIKEVIDGADVALLECWAVWLAAEAETIRRFRSQVTG